MTKKISFIWQLIYFLAGADLPLPDTISWIFAIAKITYETQKIKLGIIVILFTF